jgi:hypothetical protein
VRETWKNPAMRPGRTPRWTKVESRTRITLNER